MWNVRSAPNLRTIIILLIHFIPILMVSYIIRLQLVCACCDTQRCLLIHHFTAISVLPNNLTFMSNVWCCNWIRIIPLKSAIIHHLLTFWPNNYRTVRLDQPITLALHICIIIGDWCVKLLLALLLALMIRLLLRLSVFSFHKNAVFFALVSKLDYKLRRLLYLGHFTHLKLSLLCGSQNLHLLFFGHLLEFGASLRNKESGQTLSVSVNGHRLAHVRIFWFIGVWLGLMLESKHLRAHQTLVCPILWWSLLLSWTH